MFDSAAGQLLLTTTRITTKSEKGVGVATGFFYSCKRGKEITDFIVTSKHVIENCDEMKFTFLVGENGVPNLGEKDEISLIADEDMISSWVYHNEYDLAAFPSTYLYKIMSKTQKNHLAIRSLSKDNIPSDNTKSEFEAIEDIYFIGYPDGLWDIHNYLPIVRKGISATPINVDYGGKKRFLIDANVIPGSSGSPVFYYHSGNIAGSRMGFTTGSMVHFLGILDMRINFRPKIGSEQVPIPLYKSEETQNSVSTNIGGVIKSSVLYDMVEYYLKNM